MRAYYYDNADGDPREPHDGGLGDILPGKLAAIGVHHERFEGDDGMARLEDLAALHRYKNRDVITISPHDLPDYDKKIIFFEEHLHDDDEVRYILDGSGYFDVRDADDKWIRIAMEAGDLIILPAGIYHRFTVDRGDYIKAMRLFKEDPKWTPLNRPADENEARRSYLASIRSAFP